MTSARAVCSVEECGRKLHARTWCSTHYLRWRKTGEPGSAQLLRMARNPVCSVDGCKRPTHARNLCDPHYRRFASSGAVGSVQVVPSVPPAKRRDANPQWRGDAIGYDAAHVRVKAARGSAKEYACRLCGGPATEWAYDHSDPNEQYADRRGPYSTDQRCYFPACRPCHKRYDANFRKAAA